MKRKSVPKQVLQDYPDYREPRQHPDSCECERCIRFLMEEDTTRGNHKGGAFLRSVIEYDGASH